MPEQSRKPHPNALPNYERAVIAREKLERYALDSSHVARTFGKSSGRDKARVFRSALGFEPSSWELLKERILEELPYCEAVLGREDRYGKRYNVTVRITGPNGNSAEVLTAWIVLDGNDYPSLTTTLCL
jgi:hypothetical protein